MITSLLISLVLAHPHPPFKFNQQVKTKCLQYDVDREISPPVGSIGVILDNWNSKTYGKLYLVQFKTKNGSVNYYYKKQCLTKELK